MSRHDFVFSNRPIHRLSRHIAFWLVWWIFFVFTYYFPHFWFLEWKLNQVQVSQTEEMGYLSFTAFVIGNTFLGSITTHLFFTYPILYLLMPKFLYPGRYLAFTTGILVLTGLTMLLSYYKLIGYYNPMLAYFGLPPWNHPPDYVWFCIWTQVVFNCPTIAGLAAGLKLFKRYYQKEREIELVAKEKARAELQLLKSQVHPHFLFNTLNNIYYFTLTTLEKAPDMIQKLSSLLYYMLHECDRTSVPLEKELRMIQDYMMLEKVRYGDQINMKITIDGDIANKHIAPLLLIPFVENSFKHGTSKMLSHAWVNLFVLVKGDDLTIELKNSKPEYSPPSANSGIGLTNVTKRLDLLYHGRHSLTMRDDLISYTIILRIKLHSEPATISAAAHLAAPYEMA